MKNYDELNATTPKEDTVISIHTPKVKVNKVKQKSPTVVSIMVSAMKAENFKPKELNEDAEYKVPVPKFTIVALLLIVAVLLLLLVMGTFVDNLIMIPLILMFAVFAMPCLIMVFFIEFNTRRDISAIHIVLMCLLGIFAYAIVEVICNKILISFVFKEYIDSIGRPIAWTICLYILVFIFCNVLRVTKLPECLLISVSFAVGYSIGQSLLVGFSSLFVDTSINIIGEQGQNVVYVVQAIINESRDLAQSVNQLKAEWFVSFIYKPLFFACLAVIVGSVVSQHEYAKAMKKPVVKSVYLLVLLNLVLYVVSEVETNFVYFNVILRALSFISAVFLALRLLNFALYRGLSDVS